MIYIIVHKKLFVSQKTFECKIKYFFSNRFKSAYLLLIPFSVTKVDVFVTVQKSYVFKATLLTPSIKITL
jgi:glycogen debranching enzyme